MVEAVPAPHLFRRLFHLASPVFLLYYWIPEDLGNTGIRREALLLKHTKGADVIEAVRDDRFFEKPELPDMQQHPRMILGQQRHIERTTTRGDMVEADLVAEDGLSGPG